MGAYEWPKAVLTVMERASGSAQTAGPCLPSAPPVTERSKQSGNCLAPYEMRAKPSPVVPRAGAAEADAALLPDSSGEGPSERFHLRLVKRRQLEQAPLPFSREMHLDLTTIHPSRLTRYKAGRFAS